MLQGSTTIRVGQEWILSRNISFVRNLLNTFIPKLLERNRNKVRIEIIGYEQDPRQLFLINEVRAWFHKLFDEIPELFYWMDMSDNYLEFYALMMFTPKRVEGGTILSPEDMQKFLTWGYVNLNEFCAKYAISPDSTNQHISMVLGIKD